MKTTLKLEGMHCSSCALNIDFDLEDIDGVQKAQTSYAKAEISVEFDEKKVSLQKIMDQIKKTGYKALL